MIAGKWITRNRKHRPAQTADDILPPGCVFASYVQDKLAMPPKRKAAPGVNVVALKLKDGSSVRGIFVQVGDLAQAIVQHPRGVSARRWHFLDSWRTVASFGEDSDRIPLLDGSADPDSAALESPAWETVESYSWKA